MNGKRNRQPVQPDKPDPALPTSKRKPQKRTSPSQSGSDSADLTNEIDISPWTPEFKQLEQVFRSLNTVYTFCCTRKHFPTTFDNLKSSVENLTRRYEPLCVLVTHRPCRPLSVDDIVRIKSLLPESINFGYVDENHLQVNAETSSSAKVVTNNEDIFKLPSGDISTVLYFEFVDGELRPKLNRRKG